MPVTIAIIPPNAEMIGLYSVDIDDNQLTKDVVANTFAELSVSFIYYTIRRIGELLAVNFEI